MATRELTYEELNESLIDFLLRIHSFDFYLHDFFSNQFQTGIRYIELYELIRWSYIDDNQIILNTAKDSYDRTFTSNDITFPFYESIITGEFLYNTCAYTTTSRYFKRYYRWPGVYVGTKSLSTHIFRHHKAKQLKHEGLTDLEIQLYFGEKDLKNVQTYIYSQIFIP